MKGLMHGVGEGEPTRFETREEAQYEVDAMNWMMAHSTSELKLTFSVHEAKGKPATYDDGWT